MFSEIIKYTFVKKFKEIDMLISVVLIFASVLYGAKPHNNFLTGYFVVGVWQVISMLIHFFNHWFCGHGSKRYTYQWSVLVIVLFMLLGLVIYPVLVLVCFILLFVAPVMAIYYTWLCYEEIYVKMKRPLDMLK